MNGLVDAVVGFAAGADGSGVAYIRLGEPKAGCALRVGFAVKRLPALLGREIGYAALRHAAAALHARGVHRVRLTVEDERLAEDLHEHREVPHALTMSYVRLRCQLNQFREYEIGRSRTESDLTARARSEVAMHAAA